MKKHIIAATITMALTTLTTPVLAKNTSDISDIYEKPTMIGLGSGLVAGAMIAGPLGAAIAGTIGLLIGNAEESHEDKKLALSQLNKQNKKLKNVSFEKQNLISKLSKSEQQNNQLMQQLQLTKTSLASAETLEKLKLNLQFKINSSDLASFYQEQVKQLATLMKNSPELTIHLSGFADRNGDEKHNLALSANRINTVKNLLMKEGVDEQKILTTALGESSPIQAQQNYQNDFYDRRVEIKLQPQQVLTAGN